MIILHMIFSWFDALAWWQQLGIGAVALACASVAVGTAYFMREIVGRSVETAGECAREAADRLADEPPRPIASFKVPAKKGIQGQSFNQHDFATLERRGRLRQAQSGRRS